MSAVTITRASGTRDQVEPQVLVVVDVEFTWRSSSFRKLGKHNCAFWCIVKEDTDCSWLEIVRTFAGEEWTLAASLTGCSRGCSRSCRQGKRPGNRMNQLRNRSLGKRKRSCSIGLKRQRPRQRGQPVVPVNQLVRGPDCAG